MKTLKTCLINSHTRLCYQSPLISRNEVSCQGWSFLLFSSCAFCEGGVFCHFQVVHFPCLDISRCAFSAIFRGWRFLSFSVSGYFQVCIFQEWDFLSFSGRAFSMSGYFQVCFFCHFPRVEFSFIFQCVSSSNFRV